MTNSEYASLAPGDIIENVFGEQYQVESTPYIHDFRSVILLSDIPGGAGQWVMCLGSDLEPLRVAEKASRQTLEITHEP